MGVMTEAHTFHRSPAPPTPTSLSAPLKNKRRKSRSMSSFLLLLAPPVFHSAFFSPYLICYLCDVRLGGSSMEHAPGGGWWVNMCMSVSESDPSATPAQKAHCAHGRFIAPSLFSSSSLTPLPLLCQRGSLSRRLIQTHIRPRLGFYCLWGSVTPSREGRVA